MIRGRRQRILFLLSNRLEYQALRVESKRGESRSRASARRIAPTENDCLSLDSQELPLLAILDKVRHRWEQ
jgi:hypothetical protein